MKQIIHSTTRLSLRLLLLAVFLTGLLVANSPTPVFAACGSSGVPAVSTDQADYPPFGTAAISGSGFGCGEILSVLVEAPDGSTYSADGSGALGPDLVTTDGNGAFVLNYSLSGSLPGGGSYIGQEGAYSISVTDPNGMVVASATFTDGSSASHMCVATTGGVKCWGDNGAGQLGDGTTVDRLSPVDVVGLTNDVIQISMGATHTCVLTTVGGVKCWGSNYYGQLGQLGISYSAVPVDVVGLTSGVAQISSGQDHTCVLMASGGVKCWGANSEGQLGIPTLFHWSPTPMDVFGLSSGVAQISAGRFHTCALTTFGSVKCWGYNRYGQIGDGTGQTFDLPLDVVGLSSGVTQINAGQYHTCALTTSGGAKCWGNNSTGQLGDGTTVDRLSPVDVVGLTSGVTQISASDFHTCVLTTTGGVKCWGNNYFGQLGDGTRSSHSTPVDVVGLNSVVTQIHTSFYSFLYAGYTCALTTTGGLKCWGLMTTSYPLIDIIANSVTPIDIFGLTSGVILLPEILGSANQPPSANAGGPYLSAVNTTIQLDGSGSSDPEGDALTETWTADGGVVTGSAYTAGSAAGTYSVCLTVNDGKVDSDPNCTFVVVYDPDGGFVTGGGWIDSPAGAYIADSSLTGKATFGFVSKYKKGATVPSGNTEFQFQAGGFNFHSDTYEWLVVNQNGANAQFKGSGTVNGALDPNGNVYKFMLWAGDGSPDTFRIQIWYEDETGEHVVYDNGFDQAIGGGSIVVHNN